MSIVTFDWKKSQKIHAQQKVCSLFIMSKVASHVLIENLIPRKTVVKFLNISIGTVNNIIKLI